MSKSVVVFGPKGCGKTRHKDRIAQHFNLTNIVDDWTPAFSKIEKDTLYLACDDTRTAGINISEMFGSIRIFEFSEILEMMPQLAGSELLQHINPVTLEIDIQRVVIKAVKLGMNLRTIAGVLKTEADAASRLATMVSEIQGRDTWP